MMHDNSVSCITFSGDSELLATGSSTGLIKVCVCVCVCVCMMCVYVCVL